MTAFTDALHTLLTGLPQYGPMACLVVVVLGFIGLTYLVVAKALNVVEKAIDRSQRK